MPLVSEFVDYLNRFAPPETAADWDNVGLLAGDPGSAVQRVMTCLTITPAVVEEAVSEQVDLIVSHHPVLFRGTKKLTTATPDGRLLLPLLQAGIAVYSPHTAFDDCPGGINDGLCGRLGLTAVVPLRPRLIREFKLTVFVPDVDLPPVSDALFAAGGGVIGQYEQCSFRLQGTGSFFGTDSTNPTVGLKGRREEVPEWRLEVVIPEARLSTAIAAMRAAHSYEEPAYDVYPLQPRPGSLGSGRVGRLKTPIPLDELAAIVRQKLMANLVQVVGEAGKLVSRVAVACGAAGEYLTDAIQVGADVFVTGELRYHDCLTAAASGLGVVLPGHHATERPGVEDLAEQLATAFPNLMAWASRQERDPLRPAS